MITRALLRTKAAQVLYAGLQSGNDWKTIDNELIFSISKNYDLYHFLLLLPTEIVKTARKSAAAASKKRLKSKDDLNNSKQIKKLVENLYSAQLAKNKNLRDYAEQNEISWVAYQKEVTRIFDVMKTQEFYEKYTNSSENSFENDKNFWVDFFSSDDIFNDDFDDFLEDISIYWLDDITTAREFVVKTIREHKENGKKDALLPMFKDEEDRRFIREIVRYVCEYNKQYALLIDRFLTNWSVERVAKMDIILLKMAIAELKSCPIIPTSVTLNEYIEIAKYYSTEKSGNFINGVLHKIVKRLQETGTLFKVETPEENGLLS